MFFWAFDERMRELQLFNEVLFLSLVKNNNSKYILLLYFDKNESRLIKYFRCTTHIVRVFEGWEFEKIIDCV